MKGWQIVAEDDWVEASARVLSCVYRYAPLSELDLEDGIDHSRHLIIFSYSVKGESFVGEFEQFGPIEEDSALTLLYNPAKPDQNSLETYTETVGSSITVWLASAAAAALIIYLAHHFDWKE